MKNPGFSVVDGGSFHLPHDIFCFTLLYSIHFSSPITICFKNRTFSLRFSRESHVEIWSRSFFSFNLCGTQTSKRFTWPSWCKWFSALIWIFWVCRLSPVWYNVDCSQLLFRFDGYQLQLVYPTVEHRPARNLQHETSPTTFDRFNQSRAPSPYTAQIFLCISVAFLPFLK